MLIREFRDTDIMRIDAIWKNYHSDNFSVPDRKTVLIDAVVENDNGDVIAYGQVKLFAELMFILDLGVPGKDKVIALKLLMSRAFESINKANFNQVYAFIKDPDFALLIQKHFGFNPIDDPGQVMLWEK